MEDIQGRVTDMGPNEKPKCLSYGLWYKGEREWGGNTIWRDTSLKKYYKLKISSHKLIKL